MKVSQARSIRGIVKMPRANVNGGGFDIGGGIGDQEGRELIGKSYGSINSFIGVGFDEFMVLG